MTNAISRIRDNRVIVRGIKIFIFAGLSALGTYGLNVLGGVGMSPEIKLLLVSLITPLLAMINKYWRSIDPFNQK